MAVKEKEREEKGLTDYGIIYLSELSDGPWRIEPKFIASYSKFLD